jgi:DNA-binding transcriptional LysR family regulator
MNDRARSDEVDLNLFRVFDAVCRAGSITRAAEELHLTQPAVSNAIARLRGHFDDPLFVREGRRIVPTPFARGLAGGISGALGSLKDTVRLGYRFDPATSTRRFVFGMRDAIEYALLPSLVRDVSAVGPSIALQSTRFERGRLAQQLGAGGLDLAVDVPFAHGEDLRQEVLVTAELRVAMRQGHPLARGRLTLDRWLSARHVVVSARATGPVLEDLALQQLGRTRDVAVRCQHYYAACEIVASSELVLTLPRYAGGWFRAPVPLHLATLPLPMNTLTMTMYWHRSTDGDPGSAWLRERFRELKRLEPG